MALNPQQQLFRESYLNPKSETFGNGYASGIKAGFEDSYARNLFSLRPDWLSEIIDEKKVRKADKNLDEMLDLDYQANGEIDANVLRVKADITKFVAETLGKTRYSKRSELAGPGGKDLMTGLTEEQKTKLDNLLT